MQETAPTPPPSATPVVPPSPLPTAWPDGAPPSGAPPEPPVLPAAPQTAPPVPLPYPLFDAAPPGEAPPALAAPPAHPPQPPARPVFRRNPAAVIVSIAGLLVAPGLGFWLRTLGSATRTTRCAPAGRRSRHSTTPPGASVKVTAAGGGQRLPAHPTASWRWRRAPTRSPRLWTASSPRRALSPSDGPAAGGGQHDASAAGAIGSPADRSGRKAKSCWTIGRRSISKKVNWCSTRWRPGTHTVKVTGPNGDASFSFEIADARLPAVSGPVNARNMIAVLVASFGKRGARRDQRGPLEARGQRPAAKRCRSGRDGPHHFSARCE